jgi:hypothetical protein
MSAFRVSVWILNILLVLGPVAGFAAGDQALHIWNKRPHHAVSQVGAPHAAWKTIPAAPTPSPRIVVAGPAGLRPVDAPTMLPSAGPRPPFVPPRA